MYYMDVWSHTECKMLFVAILHLANRWWSWKVDCSVLTDFLKLGNLGNQKIFRKSKPVQHLFPNKRALRDFLYWLVNGSHLNRWEVLTYHNVYDQLRLGYCIFSGIFYLFKEKKIAKTYFFFKQGRLCSSVVSSLVKMFFLFLCFYRCTESPWVKKFITAWQKMT